MSNEQTRTQAATIFTCMRERLLLQCPDVKTKEYLTAASADMKIIQKVCLVIISACLCLSYSISQIIKRLN